MNPKSKKLTRLVTRAAELRAAGYSWDQVAHKLRRRVRSVCNWPGRYREFWKQAIAEARNEVAADARNEGLVVLRNLLRSKDEKMQRDVSSRLVHLQPDVEPPQPTPAEQLRYLQFLEGLNDDELQSFLGQCHAPDDARLAGGLPALADSPGAA